jgi:hypothetical protein
MWKQGVWLYSIRQQDFSGIIEIVGICLMLGALQSPLNSWNSVKLSILGRLV